MGKLFYVGTSGSDDPTQASMPILEASGALDKGHEPMILMMGEAVLLMKDDVLDALQGVDFPPLRQIMDKVIDHGVPIYV